jgi:hypothetical protein
MLFLSIVRIVTARAVLTDFPLAITKSYSSGVSGRWRTKIKFHFWSTHVASIICFPVFFHTRNNIACFCPSSTRHSMMIVSPAKYIFDTALLSSTERGANSFCERSRLMKFPVFIPSGTADISLISHFESGANTENAELERSILLSCRLQFGRSVRVTTIPV